MLLVALRIAGFVEELAIGNDFGGVLHLNTITKEPEFGLTNQVVIYMCGSKYLAFV